MGWFFFSYSYYVFVESIVLEDFMLIQPITNVHKLILRVEYIQDRSLEVQDDIK